MSLETFVSTAKEQVGNDGSTYLKMYRMIYIFDVT